MTVGPVILGIGLTNKPHLPLLKHPISIIEQDGEKILRVPFLMKGKFRHSKGNLDFEDSQINQMLQNYANNMSPFGVSLNERHTDRGAWAWFDRDGGKIVREGDTLVAYGKPTSEEVEQKVKSKVYQYASVEFVPDYRPVTELEMDALIVAFQEDVKAGKVTLLHAEDIFIRKEGTKMPKKFTFGDVTIELEADENGALTITEEQLTQITKPLSDKVTTLEAKIVELTPKPEVKLPKEVEERIKMLEAQNIELQKQRMGERVRFAVEKARQYKDKDGRGHSEFFLSVCEKALALADVGSDDKPDQVIKLERDSESGVAQYFRNVITYLLENNPGTVQKDATVGGETPEGNPLQADSFDLEWVDEKEKEKFFGNLWANSGAENAIF